MIKEREEIFRVEPFNQTQLPEIVFQLHSVTFVPFYLKDTKKVHPNTANILGKIEKYLKEGCFFGFNTDLTRSRQNQCSGRLMHKTWDTVDTRYMWNYGMCKGLIA